MGWFVYQVLEAQVIMSKEKQRKLLEAIKSGAPVLPSTLLYIGA